MSPAAAGSVRTEDQARLGRRTRCDGGIQPANFGIGRTMLLCLLLMALMSLGQSVPIQCNTNFRDLKADGIEVLCPEGCLDQEVAVWGTDIYTDDSSVCKAAMHTGNLNNSGGRVRAEKRPGQDSYHQSLRNGVTTRSYGAWHGSFIIISDKNAIPPTSTPQTSPVLVQCNTQALQLTSSKTEVLCPAECLTQGTTVWGTEIYTYDSSICRAAINAGKITNAGGRVTVEKRPGQNSYQESTRNGVTTRSYGAYPESFILTSETIAIPPTSPPHTPIVPVQCNTQARQLNDSKTIVLCPEGCLLHGSTVWGTEIYTDDSSICRGAIHAGKITNAGGQVEVEKRPGQNSYQESTRNEVTSRSYGIWAGSFVFNSVTIVIPPTNHPQTHIVSIQCSTQARQLADNKTGVLCPEGCLTLGSTVWGTDIYTDDSSICRAAIHSGTLTNAGGLVDVEKRPGQSSYQESTRNEVTTRSYGVWQGSFILTSLTTAIPPTTSPQIPTVNVQCNTQARQLTKKKTEVLCPKGCLAHEVTVWGTDIYTDDSSVCKAAIHSGKITEDGGRVGVEKWPGQTSYQDSTHNGVTTRSYGAWSGSFILTSATIVIPPTNPPQAVSVQCNTPARQLMGSKTEVLCPEGCLTMEVTVWGTDIYTDDSSICQAAIHAEKITNNGGRVTVEKRPGQSSYQESTRNGVTTRSYGAWPGSFVICLPRSPAVHVKCSTTAMQIMQGLIDILCPIGCLSEQVNVWGTDIYTDDSSMCLAAIHAGQLTDAGGRVKLEKKPGQSSYQQSTRNGVTTRSYGAWPGSFILSSPFQALSVLEECNVSFEELPIG